MLPKISGGVFPVDEIFVGGFLLFVPAATVTMLTTRFFPLIPTQSENVKRITPRRMFPGQAYQTLPEFVIISTLIPESQITASPSFPATFHTCKHKRNESEDTHTEEERHFRSGEEEKE